MVVTYEDRYKDEWDDFVLNNSINGNFLQTRNFYNYHPKDAFEDGSLMFFKADRLAAVIPAAIMDNGVTLIAHPGSTYGGLVVGKDFANTTNYKWIFEEMISYFREKGYAKVELRMHNWLYSPVEEHNELCDYFFQINGFTVRSEVGFYIELGRLSDDYSTGFEKLKRRKLNRAIKENLSFRRLVSDDEVSDFYDVLSDNMKKFGTVPVHSREEILEFKNDRLRDVTSFYGVYHGDDLIAGSMVWNFCNKKVFHTQYLASRQDALDYCPNEYLYSSLVHAAREEGYRYLSYGTASLKNGWVYNESLGMYKEGFNTDSYLNRCYIWERGIKDA